MGYQLKQGQTAKPLTFLMVSSTDHITAVTGLSPTVTISKNGAAFAAPAGAVTAIGAGWYKVAGNATDENTLGPLLLNATGTGADPVSQVFEVVAFDPDDAATLGLSKVNSMVFTTANKLDVRAFTVDDKTGYGLSTAERTSLWTRFLDGLLSEGDADAANARTFRSVLRKLRNKWSISGTTITFTKEDDTTTIVTETLTTAAGLNGITASDPG